MIYYDCLPDCRGFGSLHSLLKESHYSSSSLLKSEDLLSGRSPFYSRINKPAFWTTDGDRSRSKDEFITVEFVKKVCFEMVSEGVDSIPNPNCRRKPLRHVYQIKESESRLNLLLINFWAQSFKERIAHSNG